MPTMKELLEQQKVIRQNINKPKPKVGRPKKVKDDGKAKNAETGEQK